MKRILTILIAFVYLLVSSGLVMELHHCMGKLAGSSVSLFGKQEHNDKCDNCGMINKKNDCCKDEVKLVKIQDSHKQGSSDFSASVPEVAVTTTVSPLLDFDLLSISRKTTSLSDYPPSPNQPSRCILHCIFRI